MDSNTRKDEDDCLKPLVQIWIWASKHAQCQGESNEYDHELGLSYLNLELFSLSCLFIFSNSYSYFIN